MALFIRVSKPFRPTLYVSTYVILVVLIFSGPGVYHLSMDGSFQVALYLSRLISQRKVLVRNLKREH